MKTLFTADLHLGHANIIRHCSRPFADMGLMRECLVRAWNEAVAPEDEVYVLGDFMWPRGGTARRIVAFGSYVAMLNGRKIHFLPGNHDHFLRKLEPWQMPERARICNDIEEVKVDGERFVLCHYPLLSWPGGNHGARHLHGHQHRKPEEEGYADGAVWRLDVGVDGHDFRPWTVPEIMAEFYRRESRSC
jgi:calcineurin-like phosphoesterase family protein